MANDLSGQADLATGAAQAANPYLEMFDQEDQQRQTALRANLTSAVGVNPDQFAKAKRTADYLGYPIAAVQAMPQVEQQAQVQQIAQSVQNSPTLRAAYTDADFARLAHDDHGVLSSLQNALLYATGAGDWNGGNAYSPSLAGDARHALMNSALKLAKPVYAAVGALPVIYDKAATLATGHETTAAGDAYFSKTLALIDRDMAANALPAGAGFGRKAVTAVSDLVGTLGAVMATGGGSEVPAAAAATEGTFAFLKGALAHTTRAMALPATADAVSTYQNVLEHGGDTAVAARAAITQYGVSTLSGMAPLSMEGGLLTRLSTGFVAGAASGEASRVAMNTVLPDGMQAPFNPEDTVLSGLTGMGLAGVLGPRAAPSFHEAIRRTYADAADAERAEQGAQNLQDISALAQLSKLRDRGPATFKQTLGKMAENPESLQAVYIKGDDLDRAMAAGSVSPDDLARLMPRVAEQLAQARATGGDVRIPIEDFATHIAGSPLEAAITPHLRTDVDGMTFQQSQDYFKQQASGLKDQAKALVESTGQEDQRTTELDDIHNQVLGQINATGRYRPEVASAYAKLTRSYYDATAERAGMAPKDLFAAHPLRVDDERSSSAAALSQEGDLESKTDLMKAPHPARTDEVSVDDAKGLYTPASNTITALRGADLSTYLHELGHHFFETHARIAAGENAPEGVKADFQTFLDHVGAKEDPATWLSKSLDERRAAHEEFARSFETYLMEGKAPSMELQGLFSRFRSWLISVYQHLSSLHTNLTPEVRGVMDRMIASDAAIHEAETTRGMLSMDKAPEGVTDKQFEAYRTAGADATAQAQADMTARSIRDMRWLSNAKSKAMRALQGEAKNARAAIADEVAKQVADMPVYKAKAELDAREGARAEEAKQWDANRDKVVEEQRVEAGKTKLKGAKARAFVDLHVEEWEKTHPEPAPHLTDAELDLVAEQHGFTDSTDMLHSIDAADPQADLARGLTDQRMLEEHGELTDPQSVERAAEAAIHNEARARFMATGLKMLTKSPVSPAQLARAAREAAEGAVSAKPVKDLHPKQYAAAEKRANRDVLKLAPKDTAGAAKAQREALLNNQLFTAATKAIDDVKRGLEYLKKFDRDTVRGKVALDIRDQIDTLLEKFDLRKNPSDRPTRAELNLEEWLKAQAAAGYVPTVTPDMLSTAPRIHYADMTVEQFRGLVDSVKALEQVGRQRQTITVEGKQVDLDAAVNGELLPKIAERGIKFTEDELNDRAEDRLSNPFSIGLDHFKSWLRSAAAQNKPREFQRNQFDRHEILGPFGHLITDPVLNAAYRKVDMLKGLSEDFAKVADSLGREWQDSLREPLKNTTLLDPDKKSGPTPMRFTRGRMIGMALHVGNESNFHKMTKGWGWDPATALKFLSDNMSAKDWHAVQSVWDLYEKHWPDTEAMYRRLGQTIPDKIAPRPFKVTTPEGTEVDMKGGYARISYDPLRSKRGEKEASAGSIDPSEGLFGRDYFRGNTTTNGSMNARAEGYTDRVDLDFHTIARNLTESIHDLAYRETLMDVHKILEHPAFRDAFRQGYGREAYRNLQEWIGNLANSQTVDRNVDGLTKVLAYTRTGMVINAIAFRATTVLKHGGSAGVKTLGYFAGGGEGYLVKRMAAMAAEEAKHGGSYLASRVTSLGTRPNEEIASAVAKFPEIRARLMQQDRDFRVTSHALFEPESKIAQAERFGHAAVAWSDMMTAVPTAWAAYDRAITEGIPVTQGGTGKPMTEEQAVNYANKVVREAHGSQNEAGRSAIMSSNNEAVKMFTTLYGFMNTTYGQQLDAIDKLRTKGISAAPVLARTFMAIIVPALWAGYLSSGGPDKKKGEGVGAWVTKAISSEVASTVPLVRDAVSMFEGYSHAGQVAAESWLAAIVQPAIDAWRKAHNPDAHPAVVKDVANAVGVGLHIPGLGQLGTSLQYLEDVRSGKEHPAGTIDFIKGIVKGHGDK